MCIEHTNTTKVCLTSGYIQTSPTRDGCNHTKQVALRTDKHKPTEGTSMAKPRSRQTNMEIKYRSKQTYIDVHKGNDPNPLI